MLFTGMLGDRVGHARMLQIGLVGYAGASLAASFATSGTQVIVWRSIMGIAGAMVIPTTLAIITRIFPREEQGKAIGIWAGVNSLGIALGPILGGLIIENLEWGWVFRINVPLAVVAVIAGFFIVPNIRGEASKKIDFVGAALSTVGLASLIFGLTEAGERGWTEASVVVTLVIAVVLLVGFAFQQKRVENPLLQMSLFTKRRFTIGVLVLGLMAIVMMSINFTNTLYLQFVQTHTPLETGVRFIPLALGIFIGAGIADQLVSRTGTTTVVATGFIGIAIISFAAGFLASDTTYWVFGIILFGWGFFLGNVAASATDAVMGAIPKEHVGVGAGMSMVVRMVFGAIGTVLISILGTVYTNQFDSEAANVPELTNEIISQARESIGAARGVAGQLPDEVAAMLVGIANDSFMSGWQVVMFIISGLALLGIFVTAVFLPKEDEE